MAKDEGKIQVEGTVIEALPATQFKVRLDNGHEVLAYLSGKMRQYYIRILLGDRVRVVAAPGSRAVHTSDLRRLHEFPEDASIALVTVQAVLAACHDLIGGVA